MASLFSEIYFGIAVALGCKEDGADSRRRLRDPRKKKAGSLRNRPC